MYYVIKKTRNIISIITLLIIVGIYLYSTSTAPKNYEDGIVIHFLDVGQGDSTFIETPKRQRLLIDGGPSDSVVTKLDNLVPISQRRLDAIILTHPHADHLTGLIKLLERYTIKDIYLSGVVYTTPDYLRLLALLKEKKIQTHLAISRNNLDLGDGIKLDFLFPAQSLEGQNVDNINNSSVVTKLSWGGSSAIFTGDLEKEAQSQLLGGDIKANLLKIPHHCSSDAVNVAFINKVNPKYSVISVGKDNKFGHPTASCLKAYMGSEIFRTDNDGNIDFLMTKNSLVKLNN